MSRGKASGLSGVAGQSLQLLGRTALGGLCGVGLVWTVTAVWPVSRAAVYGLGTSIQRLSGDYPVVIVGLLLGVLGALISQAIRR